MREAVLPWQLLGNPCKKIMAVSYVLGSEIKPRKSNPCLFLNSIFRIILAPHSDKYNTHDYSYQSHPFPAIHFFSQEFNRKKSCPDISSRNQRIQHTQLF